MGFFSFFKSEHHPADDVGFAAIDVETTGLYPDRGDAIIELAIIQTDPRGFPTSKNVTRVNPRTKISPKASAVHHIYDEDVVDAPVFADIIPWVNSLLKDRIVVAHNAAFDLRFLEYEYARNGWHLPELPSLCTLETARRCFDLPNYRLESCLEHIDRKLQNAHTALNDAEGALNLLWFMMHKKKAHLQRQDRQNALDVHWPTRPHREVILPHYRPLPEGWKLGEPLHCGQGVAFTGGGNPLERSYLLARAIGVGLVVKSSISGKVAVVVVDGKQQTSKYNAAKQRGIRTLNPQEFEYMAYYTQP